jgi:conjugal transfer ATP-binding protein TraC
VISGLLFGRNGGMTLKEIESMTARSRFSDYLPWAAYDRETKVYLNVDNTLGFIWECSPMSFAGESAATTLEGLMRLGLPGTVYSPCRQLWKGIPRSRLGTTRW